MVNLSIDRHSSIPIYVQIRKQIQDAIESGVLPPGSLLTGEPAIAEQLKVSIMTVRQALAQLVAEGYIERQRGKGTFVRDRKLKMHLPYFTSYRSDMRARGFVPGTKIIEIDETAASERQGKTLGIKTGSPLFRIVRLRFADDLPMMLETTWISTHLVPDFPNKFSDDDSYYETLENRFGIVPSRTTQTLEAVNTTMNEATYLGVAIGSPVLFVQGILFDQNNHPVDITKSLYRADRYKFYIERRIRE